MLRKLRLVHHQHELPLQGRDQGMTYQLNILLAVLVHNNEWAKVLSPAAPGHEPQEKGVTEEVMISHACVYILSSSLCILGQWQTASSIQVHSL